ncbi:MAG TPA: SDR family oxidoreductase, partial [Myxococcaceae bacterium]|nr:SDR family oxidoreductase [Myxococcaceae bacterium]
RRWSAQGDDVVAVDRAALDVSDRAAVEGAVVGAGFDVVVTAAAWTAVDACESDPDRAFAVNGLACRWLADACRRAGAHLVHVSTDYVFDGDHGPYDEEALPNPRGVYALTKHMGEQAARTFVPGCAIARTAVVYGWPAAGRPNFGAWLAGALEKGQPVRLFEDQFVSPSLADSVAAMLVELGERRLGGVCNTCGADVVDRVHFGRALCEVFGFDPGLITPVRMADMKLASPRPLRSGLRVDKARRELRARPLSLSESLERFHAAWSGGALGGKS